MGLGRSHTGKGSAPGVPVRADTVTDSDKVSPAHKLEKGEMSAALPFLVFSSLFRRLQSIECSFVLKTPRNRNEAFDTMKRSRYALRSKGWDLKGPVRKKKPFDHDPACREAHGSLQPETLPDALYAVVTAISTSSVGGPPAC